MLTEKLLQIAQTGTTAQGIIQKITPTGKLINSNVELELQLIIPDNKQKTYTTTTIIPNTEVEQLQIGKIINLCYNQSQPQQIIILPDLFKWLKI